MLARLSGTVTALPKVGAVIRRGGRLYAVAAEPVLLMYGAVPAYRTLAEGVGEGRDVEHVLGLRMIALRMNKAIGILDDAGSGMRDCDVQSSRVNRRANRSSITNDK